MTNMGATESSSTALAIRERTGLIASDIDPSAMIDFATKQARALAQVIEDQHLYVVMGKDKKTGKERRHVEVEGWMTLGAMNGLQAATESVIAGTDDKGHYTATAMVAAIRVADGVVVARAEGFCSSKETKWNDRDEYAIRSMAQTRAASKVFRQALAWVMVLAGFAATPAEEIPGADKAPKFEAIPVDAPTKKRITDAISDVANPGKVKYADDAQKAAIKTFMDEHRFDGWKDYFARGASFLEQVLAILNIPTEFDTDSAPVTNGHGTTAVLPTEGGTPLPAPKPTSPLFPDEADETQVEG